MARARVRSRVKMCAAHTALYCHRTAAAQRAKFDGKVHKPPLRFNVINFELNGSNKFFNGFHGVPLSPKRYDALLGYHVI